VSAGDQLERLVWAILALLHTAASQSREERLEKILFLPMQMLPVHILVEMGARTADGFIRVPQIGAAARLEAVPRRHHVVARERLM
jgi:hypothetical protein